MAPRTRSRRAIADELIAAMRVPADELPELITLFKAHEDRPDCHDCAHELLWIAACMDAGLDRMPDRDVRRIVIGQLERTAARGAEADPFDGFPQ